MRITWKNITWVMFSIYVLLIIFGLGYNLYTGDKLPMTWSLLVLLSAVLLCVAVWKRDNLRRAQDEARFQERLQNLSASLVTLPFSVTTPARYYDELGPEPQDGKSRVS